jgi:hypothetical protein
MSWRVPSVRMMWMFDIRGRTFTLLGTRGSGLFHKKQKEKAKSGSTSFFDAAAETESNFDFDAWGSGALKLI